MTTQTHNTVPLTNQSDVLAAVPHLLGFHPRDSLVLIAVHDADRTPRFGLALRSDLPPSDQLYQLAEYLLNGPVARQGVEAVLLVVVGGQAVSGSVAALAVDADAAKSASGEDLPHSELIGVLREVLGGAGISVLHASWTAEVRVGEPWRCYDDEQCRGEISDPTTSPLAAALAAAGVVTFDSREELEELVAPEAAEKIASRAARLDAMYEDAEQERASADGTKRDLEIVFAAIRRTEDGSALTEDDLLRVLIALSDNRVRDLTLSTALGEWAIAAERLWISLVRKAPSPELADVAALLAFSAYLRGEGALAGVALERIEATRPDHRLGTLLRQALDAGIPPAELAVIANDAAEDARELIEEDGAW